MSAVPQSSNQEAPTAESPDPRREEQDRLLGQKAIERGWITPEQLAEAREEQARRSTTRSIGNILASKGYLGDDRLIELLEELKGTPFTADAAHPGPFPYLFGKYTLSRELGRGGMGIVFEAKDAVLGRRVALKVILSRPDDDAVQVQEETDRFMREARLSANLSKHPHIVGVYDAGAVDGRPYLAMEFIEGSPLSKWRRTPEATLAGQVRLLQDVARGVHHAHQHGVIHRDLKPDNILISTGNQPHVTDFGLAKDLRPESGTALTMKGRVMGTPIYMSPEQAQGESTIDHRTDIYSLGVILYEALAGRPPFLGKTPIDILAKVVGEPTPSPSTLAPSGSVDPRLEAICLRAIDKDPGKRHASAAALAADLEGWLGSRNAAPVRAAAAAPAPAPAPAPEPPPPPRPRPAEARPLPAPQAPGLPGLPEAPRKKRGWAPLWIAALLLLGAAGAFFFSLTEPSRRILIARGLALVGRDEEALRITDEVLALNPSLPEAVAVRRELLRRRAPAPRAAEAALRSPEPAPGAAPKKEAGTPRGIPELLAQHPGAVDEGYVRAVARLSAEDQATAVLEKLKELNPAWNGKAKHRIEQGKVVEWTASSGGMTDLGPLRALPDLAFLEIPAEWDAAASRFIKSPLVDLSPLRGMALRRLRCPGTSVRDLSVLHGMPLAGLRCDQTEVSDLTPLLGTPLGSIDIAVTPVTDLSPLSGLPLEILNCAGTKVSDLSPLRSLPLKKLFIRNAKVTDFGPVRFCPLTVLRFDYVADRDAALLHSMTTLTEINDLPAAEFLLRYARLWESVFDGRTASALVLQPKEAWLIEKDALTSNGKECSILTREEFEDGEFRIRYRSDAALVLTLGVHHAGEKGYAVVPESAPPGTPRGKPREHELIFSCKEDQVTALLDGQPAPLKFKNGPRRGAIQIHVLSGRVSILSIDRR